MDPSPRPAADPPGNPLPGSGRATLWAAWAWWAWVGIVALAALALLGGWEDLALALDLQRHLRPGA